MGMLLFMEMVTGTNRNKMGKSRKWNISKPWHIVGKSEVQSSLYCYSVRRRWCHCCTRSPCGQLLPPSWRRRQWWWGWSGVWCLTHFMPMLTTPTDVASIAEFLVLSGTTTPALGIINAELSPPHSHIHETKWTQVLLNIVPTTTQLNWMSTQGGNGK